MSEQYLLLKFGHAYMMSKFYFYLQRESLYIFIYLIEFLYLCGKSRFLQKVLWISITSWWTSKIHIAQKWLVWSKTYFNNDCWSSPIMIRFRRIAWQKLPINIDYFDSRRNDTSYGTFAELCNGRDRTVFFELRQSLVRHLDITRPRP